MHLRLSPSTGHSLSHHFLTEAPRRVGNYSKLLKDQKDTKSKSIKTVIILQTYYNILQTYYILQTYKHTTTYTLANEDSKPALQEV